MTGYRSAGAPERKPVRDAASELGPAAVSF